VDVGGGVVVVVVVVVVGGGRRRGLCDFDGADGGGAVLALSAGVASLIDGDSRARGDGRRHGAHAGLVEAGSWVKVGPPLFAKAPSCGLCPTMSPAAAVPQLVSSIRL
jgi:hypothetical protein